MDSEERTETVYRRGGEITLLGEADTLTGGEVLAGFLVADRDFFA